MVVIMYSYWCDLGVIILKISSDSEIEGGIMEIKKGKYNGKDEKDVVSIFLINIINYDEVEFHPKTYRERMMQKGLYIGHHFGEKVKIKIVSKNEIYICARDYNRILWSYVTKLVLKLYSLEKKYLHLKSGVVEYKGKVILIVGRGGSGKSEIIKVLCSNGGKFISNTHSIVSDCKVLGIKTNIRVRNKSSEFYISPHELQKNNHCNEWQKIDFIFWVNHRIDDKINIVEMSKENIFYNMMQFSEAIATWELHEDIYDYYHSNPIVMGRLMKENYSRLFNLIKQVDNYYINLDIKNEVGNVSLLSFIDNL